jgi:hypothetical protein
MILAEAPVVLDSHDVFDQQSQQTTLYDLMATMHDVAPDADDLITAKVMEMIHSRRIRFLRDPETLRAMLASADAA